MPRSKPTNPTDPPPPKRTKRWRKRLLITGIILLILGALANGPGSRWLIHHTLRSELAKMGMEGDLRVEGHLHSGFTLLEGVFADSSTEAEIRFDELSIQYELLELLKKKVRLIKARNVKVVILASEKTTDEEFTLPDFDAIGESLRSVRELARPIAVEIEQVHISVLRPGTTPLDFQLAALSHPAGSDAYTVTAFQSNALGESGLPRQDIQLRWEEEDINLDQVVLFPDLSLSSAQVNYTPATPVEIFASVAALSSQLVAFADSTGTIEVDLKNDSLDLATTAARFMPDLNLSGTIPHLHLRAEGLLGKTNTWDVVANIKGTNLQWQDSKLETLSADLILGERARLIADLGDGINARLDFENPLRQNSPKENPSWWKGAEGTAELKLPSIHEVIRKGLAAAGQDPIDLKNIPDGAFSLNADLVTGGPYKVQVSEADWSLVDPSMEQGPLPGLKGTASLLETTAMFSLELTEPRENEALTLTATFGTATQSYSGTLDIRLPDTEWIKPFLPAEPAHWKPTGPVAISWTGKGSLPTQSHEGEATIKDLTVTTPGEPGTSSAELTANYSWPKSLNIPSLSIHSGDLWLDGSVQWSDERLSIPVLRLHDATGQLASFKGGLPLSPERLSPDEILKAPGAVDLTLQVEELKLERLQKIAPLNLPDGLRATLSTDLNIGGSLSQPTFGGTVRTSSVHLPSPDTLPLLEAELNLETRDNILYVTGLVTEPAGEVLSLTSELPLAIREWVENPDALGKLALNGNAKIDQLALSRLQVLSPALAEVEGAFNAEIKLAGTVGKPKVTGQADANMKRLPLPIATFREIRDTSLSVTLEEDRIVIQPSTAFIAGGKFTLAGNVTINGEEPVFDLGLTATHALLWRNDSFIFRTDSDLKLTGPYSKANLSGSFDLVESLFYKDIEIIPVGVPSASAPEPQLPKIDSTNVNQSIDIPAPFSDWTLDITLKTTDPILIRGNLATGKIFADARVDGTFANPRPTGKIKLKDVVTDLPFSKLIIADGSIVLRPDAPLDPVLDIRGKSTVNARLVNLFVYGPVSDPKYSLSSDRGLPESEILTLLATGTTIADLEDPEVAKSKAFQVFLDDLRRRANKPGGNKVFRKILNELDDVDLKVAEADPFSGRKFNSATLQLHERWFLSAAVDSLGNTRGLVIFSMRFH